MITAWRICKEKRAVTAFDGRGAAENPGRWNSAAVAIAYAAESRSLAAVEVLVHTEDTSLLAGIRWAAVPVSFGESLIQVPKRVPDDWRQVPAPASTRAFGDAWVAEGRSVVMRVPSVVTPGEFNYLINPRHPDFNQLKIGSPEPFSFDLRLC
ncbi:MAG: RES family NAD+ phosphorylase [Opitutaceae bacterium]